MFGSFGRLAMLIALVTLCCAAPATAQPVSFTGNYTQNFDGMGTGTTPPAGFGLFTIAGDSNTWTNTSGSNSVPPTPGISNPVGGTAGGALSVQNIDSGTAAGNQNNGYNAATSASPNDRTLVTAPTGVAGSVIQLQLTNNTGSAIPSLRVGYDTRRMQVGAHSTRTPPAGIPDGSDEIPGFWLWYSLDNGASFTNVPAFTPVGQGPSSQPVVPNSLGVTTIPATPFALNAPWANGSNLILRWVDDNAVDPSPDPLNGIDNLSISVSPVPEPSSLLCLSAVAVLGGARVVRRRFFRAAA